MFYTKKLQKVYKISCCKCVLSFIPSRVKFLLLARVFQVSCRSMYRFMQSKSSFKISDKVEGNWYEENGYDTLEITLSSAFDIVFDCSKEDVSFSWTSPVLKSGLKFKFRMSYIHYRYLWFDTILGSILYLV